MSELLLLGHRGARSTYSIPENTIASFDLALEHGCDGFEFDVRLTSDGVTVLCHDARVRGIEIARATRAELASLATLEEVLEMYAQRAFLDIELKVPGVERKLLAALSKHSPRSYVVSSFLPEVLQHLHSHDVRVPLGLISDTPRQMAAWRELPIQFLIPQHKLVRRDLIDEVHDRAKKIFVWTVNEREAMLRLAAWGADGVISDNTRLLAETLREKGKLES